MLKTQPLHRKVRHDAVNFMTCPISEKFNGTILSYRNLILSYINYYLIVSNVNTESVKVDHFTKRVNSH